MAGAEIELAGKSRGALKTSHSFFFFFTHHAAWDHAVMK